MNPPYIELNAFIKLKGLATTGGRAKLLIRSGKVFLNGVVETQNRKKLHPGDVIAVEGKEYVIEREMMAKK